MPFSVIKAIEYVLDLAPTYFWLLGPGTVEPGRRELAIRVDGLMAVTA